MKTLRLAVPLVGLTAALVVASPVFAAPQASAAVTAVAKQQATNAATTLDAAAFASLVNLPHGVEISNEDGATKLSIALSRAISSPQADGFTFTRSGFNAEALFDTPDKPIKLASLDGLGRSANVGFKAQRIRVAVHWDGDTPIPDNVITSKNFAAKVGAEKFDYVDPTTLAKQSDYKTPWSVSLGYSFGDLAGTYSAVFSASYQEAFEAQDSKTLCPPGSTSPAQCVTGAAGAPSRQRKSLISAEYRRKWASGLTVAAQATYDAENDVYGAEIPIYLPAVAGHDTNAGVKFGWRSDTDEVTAVFFVSKAISTWLLANN